MVRGKPSNSSTQQVDIPPLSLRDRKLILCCKTNHGCREEWFSVVRESGTDPWTGMRSQRLLGSDSTVLQACVLGLPLQGWKFDSESSISRENWDCLIPLPHRVRSGTKRCLIWLDEINFLYHICVDRCIPRMVNETRIWNLKFKIKDMLFVAFQQKKL